MPRPVNLSSSVGGDERVQSTGCLPVRSPTSVRGSRQPDTPEFTHDHPFQYLASSHRRQLTSSGVRLKSSVASESGGSSQQAAKVPRSQEPRFGSPAEAQMTNRANITSSETLLVDTPPPSLALAKNDARGVRSGRWKVNRHGWVKVAGTTLKRARTDGGRGWVGHHGARARARG